MSDFSVAKHRSPAWEVGQREDNAVVDDDAVADSVEVDDGHGVVDGAHVEVGSRAAAGQVALQPDSLVVGSALVDTLDTLVDSLAVDRLDSELVASVVEHKGLWVEHMDRGVVEHMGRELVVRRGHAVVEHMDHVEVVHMDHEHRGLVVGHMDPAVAWHRDPVHTAVVGMLLSQVDSLEVDKPALGVDN